MTTSLSYKRKFVRTIAKFVTKVFRYLPKDRYSIVFDNFNGRGYGENPKYICEGLKDSELPLKRYWLVNDINDSSIPEGVIPIKYTTIGCLYRLARAKVIIHNVKVPLPFIKTKKQFYIQTWHGGMALKLIEGEIENMLPKHYVEDSKYETSITDLILSAGMSDYNIITNHFWGEKNIIKSGLPRNDVFFNIKQEKIDSIKKTIGIPKGIKLLLYAPTFRDNDSVSGYNIDLNKVIETLEEKTAEKWIALVRLHPNVKNVGSLFSFTEKIINVCSYPDPQELSIAADLLITDYSSMSFDFILMDKPVFLYISDYQEYIKSSRPLRPLFNQLPIPKSANMDELCRELKVFDNEEYQKGRIHFLRDIYGTFDDGNATKRIVEIITDVIKQDSESSCIG